MRKLGAPLGLFLLSPFVGEYLLGNMTLVDLVYFPLIAGFYGFGALFIRETARRWGGGWATIGLLGVAYSLFEEGPVDQLFFNDHYAGFDNVHGATYQPWAGTSILLVQTILGLHTVWSICVPIALVETFTPGRRASPWLGKRTYRVTGAMFFLVALVVFSGTYDDEQFMASPGQFVACFVFILLAVLLAYRVRSLRASPAAGRAPSPWLVFGAALVITSAWWGPMALELFDNDWFEVGIWFAAVPLGVGLIWRWSARAGWGAEHRLALAAGATTTYAWVAFPVQPESSTALDLAGNVVFAVLALVVMVAATRRLRQPPRAAEQEQPLPGAPLGPVSGS